MDQFGQSFCSLNSKAVDEKLLGVFAIGLKLRHQFGHFRARGNCLQRDDVELAGVLRAVEVGDADAVVPGLAWAYKSRQHGLAVVGVEHDDLVALRIAGEVPEQGARAQIVLLCPHPFQTRPKIVVEQLGPGVTLDAAAAPVELEEDVRVEVVVERVHINRHFLNSPPGWGRHRDVDRSGRADAVVICWQRLRLRALFAQSQCIGAQLCDEHFALLRFDQRVHLRQPLKGVLAEEDAGLVNLVRCAASGVERAQTKVLVDRRAADQNRVVEPLALELLDAERHLLGG
ncbi:unannotated protein [freshwater metagenome]|uniref:Unannotated protein n=1 Tax=freshwater metagenome TaxID=449393 RepID=A0A6J7S581_9ZZZZ